MRSRSFCIAAFGRRNGVNNKGMKSIAKAVGVSLAISMVLLTPTGFSYYLDHMITRKIDFAFENGISAPSDPMDIERKDLLDILVRNIEPVERRKDFCGYCVVSGDEGTGKTTAARTIARNIGKGVIYIDIPSLFEIFPEDLVEKFGLDYDKQFSRNLNCNEAWDIWIHEFEAGAKRFQ
jgi:hypothetical protein